MLDGRPMVQPAQFTRDPELTEVYWRVREGLHGLLGKLRPRGTSLIIEDVCVPPERIAEAAADDARAAGPARLPAGRGGPRVRRQPALHADPRLHATRPTATATRRSWGTWSS